MAQATQTAKPPRRVGIGREVKGIILACIGVVMITSAYLFMRNSICLFSCTSAQEAAAILALFLFFTGFVVVVGGAVVSVTGSRV